jgi:anti-sigma-K factor RskA
MNDAELHLLAGPYAVDALDDDERHAFEEHLSGCPTCTEEVVELQATAARLGAASALPPPPELRAAVLSAARETAQMAAAPPTPTASRRPSTLLALAAGILVVALAAVGAWGVSLHRTVDQVTAQAAALTSVLTAADATSTSSPVRGGGRGTVVVSRSQGEAVFLASDLAAPGPGKAYQLWFIDSAGAARSAGVVRPGPAGGVATLLDGRVGTSDAVGLTVEPASGSTAPTTTPVLVVRI